MKIKEHLKQGNTYQKAAKLWWDIQDDISTWQLFILSSIPGKFGIYLRSKILVRHFGACGTSPFIMHNIKIDNPDKLFVGDNFRCNVDLYISAGGTVEIGDNVIIGPSVRIWSINHKFDRLDAPIYEQGWVKKKVVIEDDVWIAANAIILPGASIGKGSILGAGSVLSKATRPYSIMSGNPARTTGYRVPKEEHALKEQ